MSETDGSFDIALKACDKICPAVGLVKVYLNRKRFVSSHLLPVCKEA